MTQTAPSPKPMPPAATPPAPVRCPAAAAAMRLLEQCDGLVSLLGDDAYRATGATLGGSIGKHVRHTLDHFAAALTGVGRPDHPIDYDRRERGVPVETDRAAARQVIASVLDRLGEIDASASASPVTVRVMLAEDGAEATMSSTLGRELAFAAHHAVHHHAMIKAIAAGLGVACPDSFGKAPSTLNHEAHARGGDGGGDEGCGSSGGSQGSAEGRG